MSRRRAARMGSLAAGYSLAVLVAATALAVLTARHPLRFDTTRDHRMSLSAETRRVVASIPNGAAPVDILAVASYSATGDPRSAQLQIQPLLELFAKESSGRITTRLAFAESEPGLVQSLALDKFPTIVLRWTPPDAKPDDKPRERRTDVITEQGIAETLQSVIEGRRGQAYLLMGHGEMQRDDRGPTGFTFAAQILSALNLEPHDLLLGGKADIPADADLVVVAGADDDLLPNEIDALRRYADHGGRLLVLHGAARDPARFPALEGWLRSDWGVGCVDGVVADLDAPLAGNQVTLLVRPTDDATHPIVRGFSKLVEMAANRKLAVDPAAPDGVKAEALLQSGPRSWLETDFTTPTPHFDETDLRGPHAVLMASTRKPPGQEKEARLVVFGSRLFASNLFMGQLGNSDLLRNSVSWLTGREADIAARAGSGQDGTVVISGQEGALVLVTTLAVPAIVAIAGIAIWWWRRRL